MLRRATPMPCWYQMDGQERAKNDTQPEFLAPQDKAAFDITLFAGVSEMRNSGQSPPCLPAAGLVWLSRTGIRLRVSLKTRLSLFGLIRITREQSQRIITIDRLEAAD